MSQAEKVLVGDCKMSNLCSDFLCQLEGSCYQIAALDPWPQIINWLEHKTVSDAEKCR